MFNAGRNLSDQDRRVYVGNLAYEVKWHDLKDFMRQAGEVLFAEVLTLPNGKSKGCGVVEYANRDQAQYAIANLSNQLIMGRPIYVREDREVEPVFNSGAGGARSRGAGPGVGVGVNPPIGNLTSGVPLGAPAPYIANAGGSPSAVGANGLPSTQLYVGNLPFSVGWQDLKDLFRSAGNVIRADVLLNPDGRSKGSGIVVFENVYDAQKAIESFNGYEWSGRVLEVRVDRFPAMIQPIGGRGGFGGYGGYRGNYQASAGGMLGARIGINMRNGRPDVGGGAAGGIPVGPSGYGPSRSGPNSGGGGEPNPVIFVGNLPWSTSNQDLIELFETIGRVERAQILYLPNGRSQGCGVAQMESTALAELAITKFNGYNYGNRDLVLSFARNPESYFAKAEPSST